jgi:glycosyltransferase involved in cell wall biosynthesis
MPNRITIGVDVRDLKLAKTGTKTYLEELCTAFKQLESDDYQFKFLDTNIPVYAGTSKIGKYIEHFRYQIWKQLVLPIRAYINHCDVLFCTDNFVPLVKLGYKTVPVFHDAFFFEDPADYGKLWLKLYHLTAVPAAKNSVFIVTPSVYAQQQIHKHTGIPLSSLKVVYEGPKTLEATPGEDILARLKLQHQSYILHVGSMFKRKNIPALVYAFKQLKDNTQTSVKLVLAGPSTASKDSNDLAAVLEAIKITGLTEEVILTGYLSDSELAGIYAGALMYVFPSNNEGFGIPVLEAFKYNLPVLVADNTCLPEIGGDAVLTFDPFDTEDIYLKMKITLQDESLRQDLINKGQIRLQDFSWVKTSLQLLALFKEIRK